MGSCFFFQSNKSLGSTPGGIQTVANGDVWEVKKHPWPVERDSWNCGLVKKRKETPEIVDVFSFFPGSFFSKDGNPDGKTIGTFPLNYPS